VGEVDETETSLRGFLAAARWIVPVCGALMGVGLGVVELVHGRGWTDVLSAVAVGMLSAIALAPLLWARSLPARSRSWPDAMRAFAAMALALLWGIAWVVVAALVLA
jgi:hypothetical protein